MNAQTDSNQEGLLNVINQQDRNSQVYSSKQIFLDEGDSRGGLVHIMERHANDFHHMLRANGKQAVATKIKEIVSLGDFCDYGYQKDSRGGFIVCYQVNEGAYLIVVVSDKGFIVSSYPKDKLTGNWDYKEKKRKKEKKEKKHKKKNKERK